jgi:hypothetical protein
MGDGQHTYISDHASEMDHAIRRGIGEAGCRDVDPAMPSRVLRSWGDEGSKDLACAEHRPRPARLSEPSRGGRRSGKTGCEHERRGEQERADNCEAKHPPSMLSARNAKLVWHKYEQNRREMRPVGERCYSFGSTRNNPGDYACPLPSQLGAHNHSVSPLTRSAWPCADTRFRAKRCE